MFRFTSIIVVPIVSLVALAGCGKGGGSSPSAGAATAAPTIAMDGAQAKEVFNSRCAACHGEGGYGNGPGSVALNPKPRNYHDKVWQAKVTDDDIRKTITYGGAAGGKSPMMAASPDLEAKPDVIEGLVHLVREFGK